MENKIEVEEYIRTKDGRIDKVDRYSIGCCVYHCKNGMCIDECETVGIPISNIKIHSLKIIDLIEKGDYVNGYLVIKVDAGYVYVNKETADGKTVTFADYQINSIVTKEQFKIVEYEV